MPGITVIESRAGQVRHRWRDTVHDGQSLTVGRDGDVALGVTVIDNRVSRLAAVVALEHPRWRLECRNRNGAELHLWGHASRELARGHVETITWPRVGVYVRGEPDLDHWLLLEDDRMVPAPDGGGPATVTDMPDLPPGLTAKQLDAVFCVFADHLAWPPRRRSVPRTLEAAARRLGISEDGVRDRLEQVQKKAYRLGSPPQLGLTDPRYVHTLVQHRYVTVEDSAHRHPTTVA
ncbi:hypothetical protein ACTMSW_09330 [Micromonospora sp. BQ11]|uniref:hypothetical protein n=1 Tax=Micromonospora sp. BQ11 TaxID=3452212 RepID=UPI003F8AC1F5